eukprot:3227886-Karenia_brevis.AAC.1
MESPAPLPLYTPQEGPAMAMSVGDLKDSNPQEQVGLKEWASKSVNTDVTAPPKVSWQLPDMSSMI